MPTLIIHGDDDQIVPIGAAALSSAKLVRNASFKISRAHRTASQTRTRINSTPTYWHSLRPEVALSALYINVSAMGGEARKVVRNKLGSLEQS